MKHTITHTRTRTHSSTKEIKKYEWKRFRYIHFGMIHYLIELVFCAEHFTQKWLWSNSSSYSNEFNTKKIEYAMLQVNILQRIGSILESEWESSILTIIIPQEPETVRRRIDYGRKKERKKTKIRTIHSTHRHMLLGYVRSWGHQWVMDQHGMASLSTYSL